MSNEIKRMKYFNGLLLKEDDLNLDQNYHTRLHRLHNGYFHDWGIVDGLEVTPVAGYLQVKVSPGYAIDRVLDEGLNDMVGRDIWVCENHPDNLIDLSKLDKDKDIYITVKYHEVDCDTDITKGENESIHMWERGEIKSKEKQELGNPSEDIILARVRVIDEENQTKIVIDDKEADGTQLRKYAVPDGASQEFQKIYVGEKGKSILPYISGPTDDERKLYLEKHEIPTESDGLIVHAPYTLFYGPVISDTLKTNGDMDVNGTFSVKVNTADALQIDSKGDVSISNSAVVSGALSATGGLSVSGDSTTLDTQQVVMTGNMLTVNKYTKGTNETEPRKESSGIEVYRGGDASEAKLLWDETEKAWKAGTQDSLHKLAYGPDWDSIHNGSNVDTAQNESKVTTLHKHSKIWDSSTESKEALTADEKGNISIGQNLNVSGSVVTEQGIEVSQKNSATNARLVWNEEKQSWQIGLGDDLNNIPYGEAWDNLVAKTNADERHHHAKLFDKDNQEALGVQSSGDVNVTSNLTVGKDLKVEGTLTVLNNATEIKYIQKTVSDNVLVVNKPEPESSQIPVSEGGLEVYRGEGLENARIIWDEGSDSWKMGTGKDMSVVPGGIEWEYLTHGQVVDNMHVHGSLAMEDGTVVVSVDKNGNVEAEKNVEINGNLTIDENEFVMGDVDVKGSVTIEGDLTVLGASTTVNQKTLEVENSTIIANKYSENSAPVEIEGGLEVYRGGNVQNAKLLWNEKEGKWKIGLGDSMNDIIYGHNWDALVQNKSGDGLHTHGIITDSKGNVAINANSADEVVINKAAKVYGGLDVDGEVNILGDLNVTGNVIGTVTYLEKTDMKVQDNLILLNKFEGDKPPVNESGLEIYRGESVQKARLVWDEAASLWKVGIGDKLNELAYGTKWSNLTDKRNADALHTHGQLFNEKGNILSLSTTSSGNIDVRHDLNVNQDLTIAGNLNVKGKVTTIKSKNIDIQGNILTMNKDESGELLQDISTYSVFRGINEKNAILRWDEQKAAWKIGLSEFNWNIENSGKNLDIPADYTCLIVNKDGSIQAPAATILNDFHANKAVISSLDVSNPINAQNGIQFISNSGNKPYIKWSEDKSQWKIGIVIGTGEVNCISAKSSGYVGIGNDAPNAKLDVSGSAIVSGDIKIGGKTDVKGDLSAGNTTVNGSINAKGGLTINKQVAKDSVVSAIEINRGIDDDDAVLANAKIIWDEQEKIWKVGYGDQLTALNINNAFKSSQLYNTKSDEIAVNVSEKTYVGIGTESPTAKLEVVGDVKITKGKNKDESTFGGSLELDGKVKAKESFELSTDSGIPAILTWDSNKWKAGTKDNLQDICLGDHKHTGLHNSTDKDGQLIVYVNEDKVGIGTENLATNLQVFGKVQITEGKNKDGSTFGGTLELGGKVTAKGSFELSRGSDKTAAELTWNETDQKWKAGTTDNLQDICLGDHKHSGLYTSSDKNSQQIVYVNGDKVGIGVSTPSVKLDVDGDLKVKIITAAGDIRTDTGTITSANATVNSTLTAGTVNIKNNLTVDGNLSVKGEVVTVNATTLEVKDNIITLNKYQNQAQPLTQNSGIEVFRGGSTTYPNAQIIWNETAGLWQAGTLNNMTEISLKGHSHPEYQDLQNLSDITSVLKFYQNNVGIGTPAPTEKLTVSGNAKVTAALTANSISATTTLTANSATISTTLKSASATITGSLSAGNSTVNGALTVTGALSANDATITTTLKSASANITGSLSAGDTTINGALTTTGALTANDATIKATFKSASANITGSLSAGDTTINGALTTTGALTANDATIKATLKSASADITGSLSAGDTTINGALTANDIQVLGTLTASNGFAVSRGASDKANLVWNEETSSWQAGIGVNTTSISLSGHKHDTLYAKDTPTLIVSEEGNVGIGTAPETDFRLTVNGDFKANKIIGNIVTQTSSRELKENIAALPVKAALDLLKNLNPVTFDYKMDCSKKHNIGFIAEDVPGIFTSDDCKSVSIMDIVAVLTAVVKKQQKETSVVKKQLTALQKQVADLIGA